MKKENYLLTAAEVAETLGISKGHAYKLIRELNEELQSKGYLVVAGKYQRHFGKQNFMVTIRQIRLRERGICNVGFER